MKILTLAAAALIAAASQRGAASAQTKPDQDAAEIAPDLLATIENDFKGELEDAKSIGLECPPLKDAVRAMRFDLNRSKQALLVEGTGPCLAGAPPNPGLFKEGKAPQNRAILLYVPDDNGWRRIFHGFGQGLELCVQAKRLIPLSQARLYVVGALV